MGWVQCRHLKNCGYCDFGFVLYGNGGYPMPSEKIRIEHLREIFVVAGVFALSGAFATDSLAFGFGVFAFGVLGGCLYRLAKS